MATFTKEEILRLAPEEGVNFIRLMFTDLFGVLKNVEIPLSQLELSLIHISVEEKELEEDSEFVPYKIIKIQVGRCV